MIPINSRIIAATNQDLEAMIQQGEFRSDLYYRLNVIKIVTPPLREHMEDVPLLVDEFVRILNRRLELDVFEIDPGVYDLLSQYNWPGNVRELQNAVECAMNYAHDGTLLPIHFRFFHTKPSMPTVMPPRLTVQPIDYSSSPECQQLTDALVANNGNKLDAAKSLGWSRSKLYRKMEKYGLN